MKFLLCRFYVPVTCLLYYNVQVKCYVQVAYLLNGCYVQVTCLLREDCVQVKCLLKG